MTTQLFTGFDKEKDATVSLRLDKGTKTSLQEVATTEGLTISVLIRKAMQDWLRFYRKQKV